jgi:hypothetical protein
MDACIECVSGGASQLGPTPGGGQDGSSSLINRIGGIVEVNRENESMMVRCCSRCMRQTSFLEYLKQVMSRGEYVCAGCSSSDAGLSIKRYMIFFLLLAVLHRVALGGFSRELEISVLLVKVLLWFTVLLGVFGVVTYVRFLRIFVKQHR